MSILCVHCVIFSKDGTVNEPIVTSLYSHDTIQRSILHE